jgi:hypothetical protein
MTKELQNLEIYEQVKDVEQEEFQQKLKELGYDNMDDLLDRIEYLRDKLDILPKESK